MRLPADQRLRPRRNRRPWRWRRRGRLAGCGRPRRPAFSASGIEAAEVLACRSTVTITFVRRQLQALADGVDDPPVGLVRHQPVEIGRAEAALVEHGQRGVRQARRPRSGTPRGRSSADARWSASRTGRRRHRDPGSAGRRRRDGSPGCRGRSRAPAAAPRAGPRPRHRRRTGRRCRDPASRAGARRSRRRSPARSAPGRRG